MKEAAIGHLQGPDYFMLAGYFVLMLGIGVYFYRHMKDMKAYFSGGNKIPWWLSGVSFYMTSFSVAAFVFYPSVCYRQGWVGITLLWVAVPAAAFSVTFFGHRWRRARVDSPVEYLESRYSPALRQLFAWQGVPVKIVDDGIKLVATGTFISICTGIDKRWSILGAGGIMLIYTFMGGLWAVAVTDFIQFVVLAAGIFVILPLSLHKAGGLSAILDNAPDGFFKLTSPEFDTWYILPLILLYCLAWSSINWSLIQKYYCVPTESDAKKVGWLVVALYVIGPPIMFLPAIAARQFLPPLEDAGNVYPVLCATLLPAGMLGLAIAAMFSATMSTLSGDYNVAASVLTNDMYKRLIRPQASQRELVFIGRLMTLLVGITALGVAFLMSRGKGENLFRMMVTLFGIATAPVAVPMLLGLISKRFTSASAMVGFLLGITTGIALFVFTQLVKEDCQCMGILWKVKDEAFVIGGIALKMEIVMFGATSLITFLGMILTTLASVMSSAEQSRIAAFHRRIETPIGGLEEDQEALSESGHMLSPFRVVGVCVLAVGCMMLAILPWMNDALARNMDIGLGTFLIVVGAIMVWRTRIQSA